MGAENSDDAGVYRLSSDIALVESIDVITPLVNDPFNFGRIAATNAISDIYAMGGRPLTAMNMVFFPTCTLDQQILGEIMRGGQSAMNDAGVCLVGGHTVDDDELKYGLSVTGVVHPEKIVRNCTIKSGDRLILTKPLGTGIISTAIKGECASPEQTTEAIRWMTTMNRLASELMIKHGATAATDITGFGLLGHACEMAGLSESTISINLKSIPLMSGVNELVHKGMVPAGAYRNRDHYSDEISCADVDADSLLPLYDPQTSGGMLISLPADRTTDFLADAANHGLFAREIGMVQPWKGKRIEIC